MKQKLHYCIIYQAQAPQNCMYLGADEYTGHIYYFYMKGLKNKTIHSLLLGSLFLYSPFHTLHVLVKVRLILGSNTIGRTFVSVCCIYAVFQLQQNSKLWSQTDGSSKLKAFQFVRTLEKGFLFLFWLNNAILTQQQLSMQHFGVHKQLSNILPNNYCKILQVWPVIM